MSLAEIFLDEWHRAKDSRIDIMDIERETTPERLVRDLGYFSYVFTHPLEPTKSYLLRILN